MLDTIVRSLKRRKDIQAWTARWITTNSSQLYAVPSGVEAVRQVVGERCIVDVLRENRSPEGEITCGSGNVTLLPGDDVDAALDKAALMASLVNNPPYGIPGPASMPDVPLIDNSLEHEPQAALEKLHSHLSQSIGEIAGVRMTATEMEAQEETIQLVNSRGLEAQQSLTSLAVEWVTIAGTRGQETETFGEFTRRRIADLSLDQLTQEFATYALDLQQARPAPGYSGPVVLRGRLMPAFFECDAPKTNRLGALQSLSGAVFKYNQMSNWELGKSIFRQEVTGDPLTLYATRCLPFGQYSNRFDEEGHPAQRVLLIKDNILKHFTANQRYAEYLSIPATGAFGDIEIPPGNRLSADLLVESYVEIAQFSDFNPDQFTGDFACEIRLGYVVENGHRKPFKGGMLVGNLFDALADVGWSKETGFHGSYQGPEIARFNHLKVAGQEG